MSSPSIPISGSLHPKTRVLFVTVAILFAAIAAGFGAFWLCTFFATADYQADYETDKAILLTLLSSQRNLRDLETMYYQDLSDYRVALAELESLVGLNLKTSETGKSNAMGKMR